MKDTHRLFYNSLVGIFLNAIQLIFHQLFPYFFPGYCQKFLFGPFGFHFSSLLIFLLLSARPQGGLSPVGDDQAKQMWARRSDLGYQDDGTSFCKGAMGREQWDGHKIIKLTR